MFASIFTTLIVKPLFNVLVLIYALLPGHNFGLAIIIFTILVRLCLWPLVKKQLHHAKAMRALQPELKRIKKEAGGNKQKESAMVMELYKERQINPFASLGIILVQLPILFGLYAGLHKIITDSHNIVTFAYPFVQHLGWMKQLAADIGKFDHTLLGFIDLSRAALNKGGGIYWPAMFIVLGSAVAQFLQTKQLLPQDKNARKLRHILRDAGKGEAADQGEVNAAVGRSSQYFIPIMIFLFTVNIASALSLYWLTSGVVAILQQRKILGKDETELEAIADAPGKPSRRAGQRAANLSGVPPVVKSYSTSKTRVIIEGEVVSSPNKNQPGQRKTASNKAKRRRR